MSQNAMQVMHARDMHKTSGRQKILRVLSQAGVYLFLLLMAAIVLFPFYWMIISSLKSLAEYRLSPPTFWPAQVLLSNYVDAFTTASLGVLFKNTMIVGIVSTLLSLVITILTAFAFARLEFKGKELLFAALLATMMIPGELFTITNFATVTNLGWRNTYTVLIVPFLVSVFYIYLLRQNFLQIPNELYLAAKVDGTSDLKYLWKVMVPLSLPTLISITILSAFAFARLEFKGKNILFAGLLATMMIPGELFTITNYSTVTNLGWINTYTVLIVPFLVSVFYIYLLRQNFLQIPNELYLAAKVDGTSDFKYLCKVMIPLSLPTLISITILKMMGAWNSYIWPRLVANDAAHRMVTNGLRNAFKDTTGDVNYPVQMAAVALVSAPLFLVFIFLRKYIMKGVSRSGIKG